MAWAGVCRLGVSGDKVKKLRAPLTRHAAALANLAYQKPLCKFLLSEFELRGAKEFCSWIWIDKS